jgi:orotidine-5'-phosphate decarboxylase
LTRAELYQQITRKQSYLCIGLDADLAHIPPHLLALPNPVAEFNRQIIAATHDLCVAYKPNIAFYEALGKQGHAALEATLDAIPPEHFTIADAKRGDIGNTSKMYAKAFFETLGFDAVTIAPYMGEDSVRPFLEFDGKWAILLALTSNKGSADFQFLENGNRPLYETVMQKSMQWGTPDNLMFVTGATHPEKFGQLRAIAPEHYFLVPGVGSQGGDLAGVSLAGKNKQVGLLVNASRSILYAGKGEDFADKAREAALDLQQQMANLL